MSSGFPSRVFRLQPGEGGIFLALGVLLFINAMAVEVSGVVAVSGFLSTVNVNLFLLVWAIDMLLLILAVGLQSLIVDRFDRVRIIGATVFLFALASVILRIMFTIGVADEVNYTLLYLLSEQQLIFFPLIFWILATDVFSMAQATRLFPVIAAFGFLGQIAGLAISAAAPGIQQRYDLSPPDMLILNVLLYMFAVMVIFLGMGSVKPQQITRHGDSPQETMLEGLAFVREVPSFRFLMLAMIAIGFVLTTMEFHFLSTASASFTQEPAQFTTFYSLYRLGIALVSLLIQSFVTGAVIGKIQIKNAFTILPIAAVVALGWMLAQTGALVSAAGGRALFHSVWGTIDDSGRKAFKSLVPEARRGRVSLFMDSYLYAMGTMIACIIIGLIVFLGPQIGLGDVTPYLYLGFGLLAAFFAVWAIFRMRSLYDDSLWNPQLSRRKRAKSVLDQLDFEE